MSKSKFMHTLLQLQSKVFFAIEQKAIVSCFVKNAALLLGHRVVISALCFSFYDWKSLETPLRFLLIVL